MGLAWAWGDHLQADGLQEPGGAGQSRDGQPGEQSTQEPPDEVRNVHPRGRRQSARSAGPERRPADTKEPRPAPGVPAGPGAPAPRASERLATGKEMDPPPRGRRVPPGASAPTAQLGQTSSPSAVSTAGAPTAS